MEESQRRALQAFFAGAQNDEIEAVLGAPVDDFTISDLLRDALPEDVMAQIRSQPEDSASLAFSELAFTTRDGLDVPVRNVSAVEATDEWRQILAAAPQSGRWPVILSGVGWPTGIADLIETAAEPDSPSASEVLAEASGIDARSLLDQRLEPRNPLLWPSVDIPSSPLNAPQTENRTLLPAAGTMSIGLFPCRESYEVPALLGYGGWNGSPSAAEHVAILRYFQDTYAARLQFLSSDAIELLATRSPSNDEAGTIAKDVVAYSPGYCISRYRDLGELAATLQASRHWYFWWD